MLVDSPKVLSVIDILSSSYGHPRNPTKTYDICTKLRSMIGRQVRVVLSLQVGGGLRDFASVRSFLCPFLPSSFSTATMS